MEPDASNRTEGIEAAFLGQIRQLIETVRLADLTAAAASGVDLEALAEQLEEIGASIAPHVVESVPTQIDLNNEGPRLKEGRAASHPEGEEIDFFPYSPIIGDRNPVSPPMKLWREGSTVKGNGIVHTSFNGPPAAVHGGMVAAILDELLGMATVLTGHGGFTGTLSIRYAKPTPIGVDLDLESRVVEVEGRKIRVTGEIRANSEVCASAEGIFIRPSAEVNASGER